MSRESLQKSVSEELRRRLKAQPDDLVEVLKGLAMDLIEGRVPSVPHGESSHGV